MKTFIILLLAAAPGCHRGGAPTAVAPAGVTVFAASSLREAVSEIAGEWSRRSGTPSRLVFEASSTLARQIREGAPADVFISAAPEWLDQLQVRERFDWLSNRLVLVAPREGGEIDLRHLTSLALANEQVPAGKYARAALAHLGVPLPARTIYGASVRDVLAKVSQGGCQAGIVYATDAAVDPQVRVVFTFSADSHPRILYSAGLLTAAGEAFYRALREPSSLEAARRLGFEVIR